LHVIIEKLRSVQPKFSSKHDKVVLLSVWDSQAEAQYYILGVDSDDLFEDWQSQQIFRPTTWTDIT